MSSEIDLARVREKNVMQSTRSRVEGRVEVEAWLARARSASAQSGGNDTRDATSSANAGSSSARVVLNICLPFITTSITTKMPAAKVQDVQPKKRVLVDVPSSRQNVQKDSPSKRRKLNGQPKNFKTPGGPNSSQVKSKFEEEVLEKLTQDLDHLKQHNAEKDQQWARPSLDDFDETRDSLCFQQIEAEEGTLHGGKTCIKLFGVTEVIDSLMVHLRDRH